MKNSIVLLAAALLCLVAFPTTTVGKYWPNEGGWAHPSKPSRNEMMLLNTLHSLSYGDSKVWKCTYSNGSAPAISISPSTPFPTVPSTPSTPSTPSPSHPAPKKSPPPPTPSLPPPTPKKSPSTPSTPPPAPKKSPSTPSTPSTAPKKSPSTPSAPSVPPPTPKKSPSTPSTPSVPPPTPKKSPSHPPSDDHSSSPSNPPPSHHHHNQNPWEHISSCWRNMGPVGMCRLQMEASYFTRLFRVSDYCCNLVVNMKNECDDVAWGFFNDPFFVPLVRYTCHVTC
ncbi:PREDICTED: merozoite surface protein CMZ-8-like [Camelina sativa]|uniref:Merozoite surface protein CMZ-8-like n=1 Tax=Camelina sativa TaxID=90675 RepID=A0ABM0ZGJ2_CAMSA|nr:PREDICTED: merozoite surface protein CMZ-8-like [Camelina sativa]